MKWYVRTKAKGAAGPYTFEMLQAMVTRGKITGGVRVRQGTRGNWKRARDVIGLMVTAPESLPEAPQIDVGGRPWAPTTTFETTTRPRRKRGLVQKIAIVMLIGMTISAGVFAALYIPFRNSIRDTPAYGHANAQVRYNDRFTTPGDFLMGSIVASVVVGGGFTLVSGTLLAALHRTD